MSFPDLNEQINTDQWERYCELLFFDKKIDMWLDISRMKLIREDLDSLKDRYTEAFSAIKELENGALSNKDEDRRVGHYWLRNPEIAPTDEIAESINGQIKDIDTFGKNILSGAIKNDNGQPFTDVLWIGIGGSGLGPLLLVNALQETKQGLNFTF